MAGKWNGGERLGFQPARKVVNPLPSSLNPVRSRADGDPLQSVRAVQQRGNPLSEEVEQLRPLNSSYLVGTCPDMCPAKERKQRERLRDLSVFERLGGDTAITSSDLAVKKFCRTISMVDLHESDIRPLPVLQSTLKYLMDLLTTSEHPFEVVHDFVFDRTRAIRQDLIMQNINDYQAICMYEEMVKFHIISHKRFANYRRKSDLSSMCHLNIEQLIKCLLSLSKLYDINRRSKSLHKNEAEFCSFYVLLHLVDKIPKMGDSLSVWYRHLAPSIVKSNEMRFARALIRFFQVGNFKRFFTSIEAEASELQLSLMEPFLNEIRARAISYVNYSGYKAHPYPLKHLSDILRIKEPELEDLCHVCGLETSVDETGTKTLLVKQTNFSLPKS